MPVVKDDTRLKSFEGLITDFVSNDGGHFILVTDDRLFTTVLRKTVSLQLGLPATSITGITHEQRILRTIRELSVRKKRLLIFFESMFERKRMDATIRDVMAAVPNGKIIILTPETEMPQLALLQEIGASNVITKPIDVNSLVMKIAYTLKPAGDLEKLIQAAQDCLQRGDYRMALTICSRVFEVKPESTAACLIMGDAYKALDQREQAKGAYEQAHLREPLYLEPIKRLVRFHRDIGDKSGELNYLDKLDLLSPLNAQRKVELGQVYLEMGKKGKALSFFDSAMTMATRDGLADPLDISRRIGDACLEKAPDIAEGHYRRAVEGRSGDPEEADVTLFNSLGLSLRKQGNWRNAVDEYKKALDIMPASEVLYYNLSLAYADGKMFYEARKSAQKALELKPDLAGKDPVVCYNLARIMLGANAKAEARQHLERALEISPGYESAKKLLETLPKD